MTCIFLCKSGWFWSEIPCCVRKHCKSGPCAEGLVTYSDHVWPVGRLHHVYVPLQCSVPICLYHFLLIFSGIQMRKIYVNHVRLDVLHAQREIGVPLVLVKKFYSKGLARKKCDEHYYQNRNV